MAVMLMCSACLSGGEHREGGTDCAGRRFAGAFTAGSVLWHGDHHRPLVCAGSALFPRFTEPGIDEDDRAFVRRQAVGCDVGV